MQHNQARHRLSLMQAFNIVSLVILLVSLAVTGWWISSRITSEVIVRVGHAASLFAESVIAPQVLEIIADEVPRPQIDLCGILNESNLGDEIVALKLWDRDGRIIYSTDADEVGKSYPLEAGLQRAWNGTVAAEISNLEREEHDRQRLRSDRLLEIYSPIREPGTGRIIAVVEFYQSIEGIESELKVARLQSWGIVTAVVAMIYLSLVFLVSRGSRTIVRQRDELVRRVDEYIRLYERNRELNDRLKAAAARTTEINERYLRRIAAELHDGPAQDIGYAILTLDRIAGGGGGDKESVASALSRAIEEIRGISAGLRSPELEPLGLAEVIDRAVRIHTSRSGGSVSLDKSEDLPADASVAVKITLFRVLQEGLSNAYRHSRDLSPRVSVNAEAGSIMLEIADSGNGVDPSSTPEEGIHLGISVMSERVELLGGEFSIARRNGGGTVVRAKIPLGA